MNNSTKTRIQKAISVLYESYKPKGWGLIEWQHVDELIVDNPWLVSDEISGFCVSNAIVGGEVTDHTVLQVSVISKRPLKDLSREQVVSRTLNFPEPIGEINIDVVESGEVKLNTAVGCHHENNPNNIGTVSAILSFAGSERNFPVIISNKHVFGYPEASYNMNGKITHLDSGISMSRGIIGFPFYRTRTGVLALKVDAAMSWVENLHDVSLKVPNHPNGNFKIDVLGPLPRVGQKLFWRGLKTFNKGLEYQGNRVSSNNQLVRIPAGGYPGVSEPVILPRQIILNGHSQAGDSGSAMVGKRQDGTIALYGILVGSFGSEQIIVAPIRPIAEGLRLSV